MAVTTEKQKEIIEAYMELLRESSGEERITLGHIAHKAGMTRENLYRNHFSGVKEIRKRIYSLSDLGLEKKVKFFLTDREHKNNEAGAFLKEDLLPDLFEKRDWLKVLFQTDLSHEWFLSRR